MMNKILFVALLGVACAASVEKREGQAAQARDTSSSYAAPAAADTGSQGNLYYYYYPVQEYGETSADAGFDIFTAIILPLLILGGLLLLLSSLTFTLTTGRALSTETQEPSLMDQLHDEVERVFYIYLNAFENEQCLQRTICEMGAYSKDLKGKDFVLGLIEPMVPEGMKGNLAIFKKAATSGYETGKCRKFRCVAPKLL